VTGSVSPVAPSRPQVAFDPAVLSGEPCILGRRIPVRMVAEMVWNENVDEAMDMWGLSREEVLVACWFVGATGIMTIHAESGEQEGTGNAYKLNLSSEEWRERWNAWANRYAASLWLSDYDAVPDPPFNLP